MVSEASFLSFIYGRHNLSITSPFSSETSSSSFHNTFSVSFFQHGASSLYMGDWDGGELRERSKLGGGEGTRACKVCVPAELVTMTNIWIFSQT